MEGVSMSSGEVHELAVRLRPTGADETQQALEDTSDTFEETSDQVEEESQNLSDFAGKFKGAMQVAVAGLGVAAAGLLRNVPVIQELMAGLEAVLTSLRLKIDQDLRPVIGPLSDEFFDLSQDVAEANSTLEAFNIIVDEISDVPTEIAIRVVDVVFDVSEQAIRQGIKDGIGTPTLDDLRIEFKVITPVGPVAVGPLVQSIIRNINTSELIQEEIVDPLVTLAQNLPDIAIQAVQGFVGGLINTFNGLFPNVISTVRRWINRIISTIETGVNRGVQGVSQLPGVNISPVNLPRIGGGQDRRQQRREFAQQVAGTQANGQQEVRVRFEPARFREFINTETNRGPQNRGRQ